MSRQKRTLQWAGNKACTSFKNPEYESLVMMWVKFWIHRGSNFISPKILIEPLREIWRLFRSPIYPPNYRNHPLAWKVSLRAPRLWLPTNSPRSRYPCIRSVYWHSLIGLRTSRADCRSSRTTWRSLNRVQYTSVLGMYLHVTFLEFWAGFTTQLKPVLKPEEYESNRPNTNHAPFHRSWMCANSHGKVDPTNTI